MKACGGGISMTPWRNENNGGKQSWQRKKQQLK